MNRVIKELEKKPLSGQEIFDSCDGEINIYTYKDLLNFDDIDSAFGDKDSIALLYETKPSYGHWVGLFRHPDYNTVEFYDSYGYFIDEQLKFVPDKFKTKLKENYPYLSYLLYNSPYEIIYNSNRIQKSGKGISSCGRHVVLRCLSRDIPLGQYIKLLKSNVTINNPDQLVTYLTASI